MTLWQAYSAGVHSALHDHGLIKSAQITTPGFWRTLPYVMVPAVGALLGALMGGMSDTSTIERGALRGALGASGMYLGARHLPRLLVRFSANPDTQATLATLGVASGLIGGGLGGYRLAKAILPDPIPPYMQRLIEMQELRAGR